MAARHCEPCGVLLPARQDFMKCPRCKQATQWDARDPMTEEAFGEFRRTYEPEKFANEQMLVVFKKAGRTVPWATVYDEEEARLQVRKCIEVHGSDAGVRVIFEPPTEPEKL